MVPIKEGSLSKLFTVLAPVRFNMSGRPGSTNIEDRRHETPDDAQARVIMDLMRTANQDERRRQEIEKLVDAVMHGYPGQPMPPLNRVTNKLMGKPGLAEVLGIPDLGFDVRDYHSNEE